MEANNDQQKDDTLEPKSATNYRQEYGRSLMVLTSLQGALPATHEFCRIRSVETATPTLWITATFLDGSTKSFRPEKIRRATTDEERSARESDC
jgi:hypothetical protein